MDNGKWKKIVIVMLIVAIFIMSSAYATLYQNLRINGNASVVASWKVEITGIKEGTKVGNATSGSIPTYTSSTATFNAVLQSSDDSIEYVITIKNSGKLDAKLSDITTVQNGNDSIIYQLTGVNKNDVLKAGESVDAIVKVSLKDNISDTIESSITMVFSYIQNV